MGTNTRKVLSFGWVQKFRMWVLTVLMGTWIYGVLVTDGYLHSPVDYTSLSSIVRVVIKTPEAGSEISIPLTTEELLCYLHKNFSNSNHTMIGLTSVCAWTTIMQLSFFPNVATL